jgi:hypothetical protein
VGGAVSQGVNTGQNIAGADRFLFANLYRWYTEKFLKGQWQKEECIVEWEAYHACLSVRF